MKNKTGNQKMKHAQTRYSSSSYTAVVPQQKANTRVCHQFNMCSFRFRGVLVAAAATVVVVGIGVVDDGSGNRVALFLRVKGSSQVYLRVLCAVGVWLLFFVFFLVDFMVRGQPWARFKSFS